MTEKGSYINWLAVTSKQFTKQVYGRHATEKPFRGMGLATFLLHIVQLQASTQNFMTDLYLQSNISSEAYQWYNHCGFKLTPSNNPDYLPISLLQLYNELHKAPPNSPYVHFVTSEEWNKDVSQAGHDPLSPEWQNQRLLLMHLNTSINLSKSLHGDINITTVQSDECKVYFEVLPKNKDDLFLHFPFNECASQINQATDGLTFLNNPYFKFQDEGEELQDPLDLSFRNPNDALQRKKYVSSLVSYDLYRQLKEDVQKQSYSMWVNDELLTFYYHWILRNFDSPHVSLTEIINVMVSKQIENFFHFDFKTSQVNAVDYSPQFGMEQIHKYLNACCNILSKKFIFLHKMMAICIGGVGLQSIHGTKLLKCCKNNKIWKQQRHHQVILMINIFVK